MRFGGLQADLLAGGMMTSPEASALTYDFRQFNKNTGKEGRLAPFTINGQSAAKPFLSAPTDEPFPPVDCSPSPND